MTAQVSQNFIYVIMLRVQEKGWWLANQQPRANIWCGHHVPMKAFFYDMMSNAIYSSMHTVKLELYAWIWVYCSLLFSMSFRSEVRHNKPWTIMTHHTERQAGMFEFAHTHTVVLIHSFPLMLTCALLLAKPVSLIYSLTISHTHAYMHTHTLYLN